MVQLVILPLLSHDCLGGGYERLAEQPIHAHPPLGLLNILGHDICQLQHGRDLLQDEVSILDGLVSKVLADINLLGSLAAADNIVSLFNACCVVLVHRRRAILGESQVLRQSPEVGTLLGISAIAPS